MLNGTNKAEIKTFLLERYKKWQANEMNTKPRCFPQYDRKNLTGSLAGIFNDLTV